jgi:DNA-binding winged helix-turn-helix (wHTH) protein/tetratricopeptide (TPR) repeat protein
VSEIAFGQFRLDFNNECLWQGTRSISLRPKAFAVLKILVENAGQLVNKQQVLDAVWPGTFVGDAVLKDNIRQLREALKDDAASPNYIETAHRRGYRFIAKLGEQSQGKSLAAFQHEPARPPSSDNARSVSKAARRVLGREAELAKMQALMELVRGGERKTVFITGEAGIGKTTLVEAFLEHVAVIPGALIVRGQCLEHFGSSEPYLPVLDGLSRLGRVSTGTRVSDVFREQAPAWLSHLALTNVQPGEKDLPGPAAAPTRERMLREMAQAIERLAEHAPLVLVLEDLHWSDYSTLDLVSYLARRKDPARLMVIGTYRPVDVILAGHPLSGVKRELQAHHLCHELPLEYLSEEDVSQYLAAQFPGQYLPTRLRRTIYRRTEGNPLFMVNLVQYLIDQKVIAQQQGEWSFCVDCAEVEKGIPATIKALIEKQVERLGQDERAVLEAASASGMDFSTIAVAAGLEKPVEWVERHCEELARCHQFLSPAWLGELPGGIVTSRHRFNHVLYREVPYSLIPAMRRTKIHQRIAERGVELYKERACEIAAELAMHFEESRDWPRALQYLIEAAGTAARRSAHHEAAELARRGLEVLESLPQSSDRAHQEITLRMLRSTSLIAIKGFAAAEIDKICMLAQELRWMKDPSPQLFDMLVLLVLFYKFSGKMKSAEETAERLLHIAATLGDSALVMEAHRAMGSALVEQGRCAEALQHFDCASSLYETNANHPYTLTIAHDCKVVSECFAARALWTMGDPEGALKRMQEALAFAAELSHPASRVFVAHFAAQLHQLRGEPELSREHAKEMAKLADEYGLDLWQAVVDIDWGWSEAATGNEQSGIDQMQRGIKAYMAAGGKLWCPGFLGLLAGQLGKAGRTQEGLSAITEALALVEETGETYSLPELYRIKNELVTLQTSELATVAS